nr:MAG TPA: hypothetical protein [Caudoviricetes sp.]
MLSNVHNYYILRSHNIEQITKHERGFKHGWI